MRAALLLMLLLSTSILLAPQLCSGQDPQLRSQAIELLEHAMQVSLSPHWPDLERVETFRVLDAATGPQDGSFSRVVVQGTGRREELTFGNFHTINVWTRNGLATVRTGEVIPPPLVDVLRITPTQRLRFDLADVIYAITDSGVNGRPARCIEFNTITGEKTNSNELCVDSETGALVQAKLDNQLFEYRDFFSFAGALIPGTILYSFNGTPHLEITQSMTELTNPTPNVLAAPPDAQLRKLCTTYRRAFGINMPQPKPGQGNGAEVVVRGLIGTDGRVHEAVVQSSERPDLDPAALQLIQQWTFTPALCDGRPNPVPASFTLQFP
jgi:TonB family protein